MAIKILKLIDLDDDYPGVFCKRTKTEKDTDGRNSDTYKVKIEISALCFAASLGRDKIVKELLIYTKKAAIVGFSKDVYYHSQYPLKQVRQNALKVALTSKNYGCVKIIGEALGYNVDNYAIIWMWKAGLVNTKTKSYTKTGNYLLSQFFSDTSKILCQPIKSNPGHVSITTRLGHYSAWPSSKSDGEYRIAKKNSLQEDIEYGHRRADETVVLYGLDIKVLHKRFKEITEKSFLWGYHEKKSINKHSCASFVVALLEAGGVRKRDFYGLFPKFNVLSEIVFNQVVVTSDSVADFVKEAKTSELEALPYTKDYGPLKIKVKTHIDLKNTSQNKEIFNCM